MTPNNYINSAVPSHFSSSDHDLHHPDIFTSKTYQAASSSSYIDFFNSSSKQDQSEYMYPHHQQPQFQRDQAENLASEGGSCETENEISDNGLKFCIWKKEDKYENQEQSTTHYHVKWQSSKMKTEVMSTTTNSTVLSIKLDQDYKKQQMSSPMETDQNSSNSTSSNSMISNMSPIRVCSDCSTTKTPLWRSGPQGPKSLCNACGIRQRKARRAIAAAAAAAAVNGTALEIKTTPPLVLKTKKYNNKTKTRQQKDKTSSSCGLLHGHVPNFKTRICNLNTTATTHDHNVEPQKKLYFEEFLLNLTNNLDYHQVFPQDEKDAAILLMALSWDQQAAYH